MIERGIIESLVEQAALAWLENVGWSVWHRVEIAPGELVAERSDYGQAVLEQRLCETLLPRLISGALRVKDAQWFVGKGV
jgi:type I restriction enzyme R subunit